VTIRNLAGALTVMTTIGLLGACSSGGDDSADPSVVITHSPTPTGTATTAPIIIVDETVGPTAPPTTAEDNQAIGPPSQDELELPPIPRACLMSSPSVVATLMGAEAVNTGALDRNGQLACVYLTPDNVRLASVRINTADTKPTPVEMWAELDIDGAEHVDGYGDDAIWAEDALNVALGGEVITFTLFPDPPLDADVLQTLTLEWAEQSMPNYLAPTPE
jgi:hypothetical protein